jgi:hypothetical protein
MLATKQAAFTNDGQRLEINILVHKQWTKIGDRHFGAQAMDKDWKSTFCVQAMDKDWRSTFWRTRCCKGLL